jgi:hypothetical protein
LHSSCLSCHAALAAEDSAERSSVVKGCHDPIAAAAGHHGQQTEQMKFKM